MCKLRNIILLPLIFTLVQGWAQDKILYCNGKVLNCKVEAITDTTVWFFKKPQNKNTEMILRTTDMFAVVFGDTSEVVVYKPDATDSKAFTVEQMRSYVAGASYARRNYKPWLSSVGAFIAGAGGGFLGFWGLLIPVTYDIGISSYAPNAHNFRKEPLPEGADEFFGLGYQDVAHKRKTLHVIASSLVGVAAIVVYTTVKTKDDF